MEKVQDSHFLLEDDAPMNVFPLFLAYRFPPKHTISLSNKFWSCTSSKFRVTLSMWRFYDLKRNVTENSNIQDSFTLRTHYSPFTPTIETTRADRQKFTATLIAKQVLRTSQIRNCDLLTGLNWIVSRLNVHFSVDVITRSNCVWWTWVVDSAVVFVYSYIQAGHMEIIFNTTKWKMKIHNNIMSLYISPRAVSCTRVTCVGDLLEMCGCDTVQSILKAPGNQRDTLGRVGGGGELNRRIRVTQFMNGLNMD